MKAHLKGAAPEKINAGALRFFPFRNKKGKTLPATLHLSEAQKRAPRSEKKKKKRNLSEATRRRVWTLRHGRPTGGGQKK